jgi:hypothetical protein
VFFFWLDIRIIPKTDHLIFITKSEDRHRDIRTTTDMNKNPWFYIEFRSIEPVFEDIRRDTLRKSWYDKFWFLFIVGLQVSIFWDDTTQFGRRNIRKMRTSKYLEILNSER